MATTILTQLAAILDGLSVSAGARTTAFTYVPWGRHLDSSRQGPPGNGLITVHFIDGPTQTSNIGGGVDRGRDQFDVHAWWEDEDESDVDCDAFREAVKEAIKAAIRPLEKSIGTSTFFHHINSADLTEQTGSVVVYHHVNSWEAEWHEVYV